MKEITGIFIDISGQHEHQSLLYKSKHLQILDAYAKPQTAPLKQKISEKYADWQKLVEKRRQLSMDQESRLREIDFCRFEIDEIQQAELKEGEEEELMARYRRLQNAQKIMGFLSEAYQIISGAEISAALHEVGRAAEYDESLCGIRDQLYDAESIFSDVVHDISSYMDEFSFHEEELPG